MIKFIVNKFLDFLILIYSLFEKKDKKTNNNRKDNAKKLLQKKQMNAMQNMSNFQASKYRGQKVRKSQK